MFARTCLGTARKVGRTSVRPWEGVSSPASLRGATRRMVVVRRAGPAHVPRVQAAVAPVVRATHPLPERVVRRVTDIAGSSMMTSTTALPLGQRVARGAGLLQRLQQTRAVMLPNGVSFGFGAGFAVAPVRTFPKRHAVIFGSLVAAVKTGGVDFVVQKFVEGREWSEMDWRRVGVFTSFGLFYMGFVQYFIYVPVMTRALFPKAGDFAAKTLRQKLADLPGMLNVAKQVTIDLALHEPFMYFPCFYLIKEGVMTNAAPGWATNGLTRWRTNFVSDVKANWMVWAPALVVIFGMLPVHMRVTATAAVSVAWTALLSSMRGSEGCGAPDAATATQAEVVEQMDRMVSPGGDAIAFAPAVTPGAVGVSAVSPANPVSA